MCYLIDSWVPYCCCSLASSCHCEWMTDSELDSNGTKTWVQWRML